MSVGEGRGAGAVVVAAADTRVPSAAGHARRRAAVYTVRVSGAYFFLPSASRVSCATWSMSSALSAGKGRFMSRSSRTVTSPTETTNAPLRGFSALTTTYRRAFGLPRNDARQHAVFQERLVFFRILCSSTGEAA